MKNALKRNSFLIVLVVILAALFTNIAKDNKQIKHQEGEMRVHFIDVGEGDSTFIELPNGKTMLVDAGEKDQGEIVLEYIRKFGIEKLDFLIGTHPHSDHIGGLKSIIENMEIGKIYMPKVTHSTQVFESLLLAIKEKEMKVSALYKGDIIYEDNDTLVEVLSPEKREYDNLNNYSIVLKITYNDTSFLLTGDAEEKILSKLNEREIDVLKIPHHGADSSLCEEFIERTSPKYGIISASEHNQYGHPHNSVLKAYENRGVKLFRTDKDGTITAVSDGLKVMIKGEKE